MYILSTFGPAVTGMAMSLEDSVSYAGGVVTTPCDRNQKFTGHTMLVVGYGTQVNPDGSKTPFWKVRDARGRPRSGHGAKKLALTGGMCQVCWGLHAAALISAPLPLSVLAPPRFGTAGEWTGAIKARLPVPTRSEANRRPCSSVGRAG